MPRFSRFSRFSSLPALRFHHVRFAALALPAYVVFQALSACTVTTTNGAGVGASGDSGTECPVGSTAKQLGGKTYCCTADGTTATGFQCSVGTLSKPGDPCAVEGSTASGGTIALSTDVCVEESCTGDRSCQEFPATAEAATGTLTCKGGVLQWNGAYATHTVTRACVVTESKICRNGSDYYSTVEPGSYYQDAYLDNYAYACGAGPYGGAPSVNVREVRLVSSSCTPAGGSAASCPIGDL